MRIVWEVIDNYKECIILTIVWKLGLMVWFASILNSNGRWCHRDMAVAYTIVEWLTYTIDNTKKKTTRKWKPFRKSFLEKCTNVGKVIVLKRRFYNRHLRLLRETHCVVNLITRTVQYSNAMGRNYPFMTSKNRLHKIQMFKNSYTNMYNKIYHCINTNIE